MAEDAGQQKFMEDLESVFSLDDDGSGVDPYDDPGHEPKIAVQTKREEDAEEAETEEEPEADETSRTES